jgi:hypothetical protein
MTIEMGAKAAQGFGNRHENHSGSPGERAADLHNNAVGRELGKAARDIGGNTHSVLSSSCQSAVKEGRLIID